MNCLYVFILFIVLRNASAQSGTTGETVGSNGVYSARDILRAIEQEVVREHLGSGGSGSADGDIQDSSSSEPFPVDERSTSNSVIRQGMLDSSSPSRVNTNAPTRPRLRTSFPSNYQVGGSARVAALPSPTGFRGEDSENDDDQTEQQSDEQSENGNNGSRMELAHFEKVTDVLKKLKKSKTDEEMADKLRTGTESLGVSFKTFEQISDLWISILRRIWRVWKAKGAKQVMHSIVNDMVTKTTQTLTPKIGSLVHRGLKSVSDSGFKMFNVSTPATADAQSNTSTSDPTSQNSETIKVQVQPLSTNEMLKPTAVTTPPSFQGSNKPFKTANKTLATRSSEGRAKQIDNARNNATNKNNARPLSTVKVTVNAAREVRQDTRHSKATSSKSEHDKALSHQTNITAMDTDSRKPITTLISFLPRKNATRKGSADTTDQQVITEQPEKQSKQGDAKKTKDNQRDKTKGHKEKVKAKLVKKKHSLKDKLKPLKETKTLSTNSNHSDVQQHKQHALEEASLQEHSVKKGLVASGASQVLEHMEQVPNNEISGHPYEHSLNKLQDKVNRLDNELTVLQTAVAGVIKKLADIEHVAREVSNVTQTAVIVAAHHHVSLSRNTSKLLPEESPTDTTQHLPGIEESPTDTTQHLPGIEESPTDITQHLPEIEESPTDTTQHLPGIGESPTNITETLTGTESRPNTKPLQSNITPPLPVTEPFPFPAQFPITGTFPITDPFTSPVFIRYQPDSETNGSEAPSRPKTAHQVIIPLGSINGLQAQAGNTPRDIDNEHSLTEHSSDENSRYTAMPSFVYENNNNIDEENPPQQQTGVVNTPNAAMKKIQDNKVSDYSPEDMVNTEDPGKPLLDTVNLTSDTADASTTNPTQMSNNRDKIHISHLPVSIGQQKVTMDTPQEDQKASDVRPIINIIVRNSETASLFQKEMCQPPCKNGGKCVGVNRCKCPSLFLGNQCERFSLLEILKKNAKEMAYKPRARKVHTPTAEKHPPPQRRRLTIDDLLRLGAATARYRLQNDGEPLQYDQHQPQDEGRDERRKSFIPHRILTRTNPVTKRKQFILEI